MKPIFFYAFIWLIVNIGVYYGIVKPWKEDLQAEENLPVGEITIDSLINTEEYLLPYYFSLKDGEVRPQMTITRKRNERYLRPTTHTYTNHTYYYGLVPILEKGHKPSDQPVLVWIAFYKDVNFRDEKPFTSLPIDFQQWKENGALLTLKNYQHFNNKSIWEEMLNEAYQKYGVTPIAPEQLFFVSPVMKEKVDWKPYKKMTTLLIIMDIILLMPVVVFIFRYQILKLFRFS